MTKPFLGYFFPLRLAFVFLPLTHTETIRMVSVLRGSNQHLTPRIPFKFCAFCCPEPFSLLVNLCRFSANTQIISTDSDGDSVQKENIVKSSQTFQAFGYKRSKLSFVPIYTLELDIRT